MRKRPGAIGWKGRPTILTRHLVESITRAVSLGLSLVEVAALHHLRPDRLHEWRAKGEEDAEAQRLTVYAEFADRLWAAQVEGKARRLEAVDRGIEVAAPGARVSPGKAATAIRAGELALKALAQQESGARGAEKRWGPRDGGEALPQPATEYSTGELARLTDEELDTLERLLLKMRGAESMA